MDKVKLHDSQFELWGKRAKAAITELLPLDWDTRIEHIGSTSVPGLPAKDVVDILIGVRPERIQPIAQELKKRGYDLEGSFSDHCWLSLPSRHNRQSIFHIVHLNSRRWTRRIAFRDLLRESSSARAKYLAVKQIAATSSGKKEPTVK
ncbi:GrpB family protein [Glutamicibacter sp.]|uniref:GrpB family protein n=1 Tax=Glutamicibacter sp. TaxID=1931995 RepID=UPI0028BF3FD6|nr:GrpB family protein [Glutamicibacter sp.]